MTRLVLALLLLAPGLIACGGDETPEPAAAEVPEVEVEEAAEEAPPPAYPNEACVRVVVVAWQGAVAAGDDITRSEAEAQTRAAEIRARIEGGADIAEIARTDSDASSSGPRGGMLGTYTREDFPPIHAPIRDAAFDLEIDELSQIIRAPYGFVVARRCAVEKIHSRHILIRYTGARNAGDDITRSQQEARARVEEIHAQATAPGADFAAIARETSEDGSAEDGGDIGMVGRGLLSQAYEEAAWALEVDGISPVVESDYGYHIIQRLADEAP